jgi:hypothetical protein
MNYAAPSATTTLSMAGASTAPPQAGTVGGSLAAGMGVEALAQPLQALAQALTALVALVGQGAGMGAGATGAGPIAPGAGAAHAGHGGPSLPTPPPRNDPRFLAGTTGPTVGKGDAPTLKIPDGEGFHGAKGRTQNDDDKKKNNYSVTDANFSNQLGLLAANPDTGEPLTYVQHIQMYAAANYLEAYAHPLYEKLIAAQNAGQGTILGAAANIMGLTSTPDPAQAALTAQDLASVPEQIPGTPMDARAYITSGKDITGQDWARPHHAGSQFRVLSSLLDAGVDWQQAMVLAGDDGISGAGRLNGVNDQNGKTGFNDGETEVWSMGAQLQQQTGIPIVQIMMGGHNHLGGDESALTKPKINKLLGLDKTDRGKSPERVAAVYQALLDGTVGSADKARGKGTRAKNKQLLKHAQGPIAPPQAGVLTQVQTGTYGATVQGATAQGAMSMQYAPAAGMAAPQVQPAYGAAAATGTYAS